MGTFVGPHDLYEKYAEVAQLVERGPEKAGVTSSILVLGTFL